MRKQYTKEPVKPNFEETYDQPAVKGGGVTSAANLVRLITQVLDEAAGGEDCYLSIGLTRSKDAAVVRLSQNGSKIYATGADWPSLLASVDTLL